MSLKVLLADDNITAQRMGSKILTDAGYEVVAVSNGAAAVKKIAAEKPDLLILDVYMPGYTGLEVCTKVKQDSATSQVPVILTVTNMEPFNQADGSRAGADGVMIKPFEASDLVAVVQKFEAKIKPAAKEPEYPQTVKMAAVADFSDASYEEWKSEAAEEPETQKVEIPHEMAAAPALGLDDFAAPPVAAPTEPEITPPPTFEIEAAPASAFGVEPAPSFSIDAAPAFAAEHVASPSSAEMHSAPTGFGESPTAPEFEIDAAPAIAEEHFLAPALGEEHTAGPAFTLEETPPPTVEELAPALDSAPPAFELPTLEPQGEVEIPALETAPVLEPESPPSLESVEAAHEANAALDAMPDEFEPTAVGAIGEVEVAPAAELETTSIESPEVSVVMDSALVTNADDISQFATSFGVDNADEVPVGMAVPEEAAAEPPLEPAASPDTVETQKLEPYEQPVASEAEIAQEAVVAEAPMPEPVRNEVEAPPAGQPMTSDVEEEMHRAFSVGRSGAAAAPAPELTAEPAPERHETAPIPDELVAQFAAELDQAHLEREASKEDEEAVTEPASTAESMAAAPEVPASQLDEDRIAVAVNRALERYKEALRAELIQAIVRELKE